MGEISELIQDGVLCQVCGGAMILEKSFIENGGKIEGDKVIEVPGFPFSCEDCK